MTRWLLGLMLAAPLLVSAADPGTKPRIVSLGGGLTETLHLLGAMDQVVGVDASTVWPESARKLPQVGYFRALSVEGIVSLNPTLVVMTNEAGPPAAIEQLKGFALPLLVVPEEHSVEGTKKKIRALAQATGRESAATGLIAKLDADLAKLKPLPVKPRVLFVYSRGAGSVSVAGTKTAAHSFIELAGATNAVTAYEGYKPLTAEAVLIAAPDVILLPSRGLEASGGIDGVLALPGLAQTPAGRARRVIAVDDLKLLGFGPRLGEGLHEFRAALK